MLDVPIPNIVTRSPSTNRLAYRSVASRAVAAAPAA